MNIWKYEFKTARKCPGRADRCWWCILPCVAVVTFWARATAPRHPGAPNGPHVSWLGLRKGAKGRLVHGLNRTHGWGLVSNYNHGLRGTDSRKASLHFAPQHPGAPNGPHVSWLGLRKGATGQSMGLIASWFQIFQPQVFKNPSLWWFQTGSWFQGVQNQEKASLCVAPKFKSRQNWRKNMKFPEPHLEAVISSPQCEGACLPKTIFLEAFSCFCLCICLCCLSLSFTN